MKLLDEIQGVFGAVLVFWNRPAEFLEEDVEVGRSAAVDLFTEGEDDQVVEEAHDAVAWLMD